MSAQIPITPGVWGWYGGTRIEDEAGAVICEVADHLERAANANLIAQVGTVYHETGLTPRQLAEQRKELLEELKRITDWVDDTVVDPAANTLIGYARAAIAKCGGKS